MDQEQGNTGGLPERAGDSGFFDSLKPVALLVAFFCFGAFFCGFLEGLGYDLSPYGAPLDVEGK